ncbi:MAG: D-amino acid aminotransferase, partial [bacterium]|nr:D-amino acid aminotransferase [bacterium]
MKTLGYYNGRIGELDEMTVPMNDRACYFGDGIYEAALARKQHIFALEEHLDRFYSSAALLSISVPQTRSELKDILLDAVQRVEGENLFVYWQMTRGTAPRSHEFPPKDIKPNLWITIKPSKEVSMGTPLKLISLEDTRFLHCNIKTLNLLPNVMAAEQAKQAGCQECVFHRGERVTECAHSNISILKNGVFRTAPTDHLILPGITRKHLLSLCKELGIPTDESPFCMKELMEADEVIVSSTTKFCSGVSEIDGVPVGGRAKELLSKLQESYLQTFLS